MQVKLARQLDTEERRQYWQSVERTARQVEQWPAWRRGGVDVVSAVKDPNCPSTLKASPCCKSTTPTR